MLDLLNLFKTIGRFYIYAHNENEYYNLLKYCYNNNILHGNRETVLLPHDLKIRYQFYYPILVESRGDEIRIYPKPDWKSVIELLNVESNDVYSVNDFKLD